MRTTTKTYNIYTFDELSEESKTFAINDLIKFILDCDYDQIKKWWPKVTRAIDKAESMQTPWFVGQYVYEYCKDDVLLPILKLAEYLEDGSEWVE